MKTEEKIGYARYADDMLVAIKSGIDSEGVYHRFRQIFQKALKKAETSLERNPSKDPSFGLGRLNRTLGELGDKSALQTMEEEVNSRTHNGKNGRERKRKIANIVKKGVKVSRLGCLPRGPFETN